MATDLRDTQLVGGNGSPNNEQDYFYGKQHKWAVFWAGLLAGAAFTAAMAVLLWTSITPRSLANFVADRISNLLPASFTEFFIQSIGPAGKDTEFFSVLIGQTIFGGVLALLFVAIWPEIKGKAALARNITIFSVGVWLVFMLLLLPLLNVGFLGAGLGDEQILTLVTSFLLFALFGAAFYALFRYLVPATVVNSTAMAADSDEQIRLDGLPSSRRRFVVIVSGMFVAAVGVAFAGTVFRNNGDTARSQLGTTTLTDGTLEGEVTSNANFYHVSKNAIDPTVDVASWKLNISGLVNAPYTLTLEQLQQMPSQIQYQTLTCISNPVAGPYISNAKWKGVQLKALLEKAGPQAGVQRVVFKSADGYTDSIAYEKALDPETLAAYEMNEVALPSDHGGPLRMLIPNIYGMKNAKWVASIELVGDPNYKGYWEQQGWDNTATIHTVSAITSLADSQSVKAGQATTIRGYAFAGERGITKVELSTDGGQTWNQTTLKPPLGDNSWSLWHYDWTPAPATQTYDLVVRATDKTGQLQTSVQADTFPAGASGWQHLSVVAAA